MSALKVHKLCLVTREARKEKVRKGRLGAAAEVLEGKEVGRGSVLGNVRRVCDGKTEEKEEIYMQSKKKMPGNNENQYT